MNPIMLQVVDNLRLDEYVVHANLVGEVLPQWCLCEYTIKVTESYVLRYVGHSHSLAMQFWAMLTLFEICKAT